MIGKVSWDPKKKTIVGLLVGYYALKTIVGLLVAYYASDIILVL
jgi:hypothetical protein